MNATRFAMFGGIVLILAILTVIIGGVYQTIAEAKTVEETVLKDANNKTMGYIEGEKVYNKNKKLIGYTKSSGTYTAGNKKIANSQLPGLLFCNEK